MSEEILKALMQLFAIILRSESDASERRLMVESFLNRQLNQELVAVYLDVFDEYYRPLRKFCGLNRCLLEVLGSKGFSHFKIKQDWVEFLEQIDTELEFLHRDEFIKNYYQDNAELPAIFIEENEEISVWVDQASINQIETLDDLKAVIMERRS